MSSRLRSVLKAVCLVVLLSLVLVGCAEDCVPNTRIEYGGIYSVTSYDKRVALTFDDGPHSEYTLRIVDALSEYGYNATFFVVGNRVDGTGYEENQAVRYAFDAGNEIGLHAYTHKYYFNSCNESVYKSELSLASAAVKRAIGGYTPRLMRPIGGLITDERSENSEYSVILWSVDSEDWKYRYLSTDTEFQERQKLEKIVDNVMSNVQDGSIVLMHDIYKSTYEAVLILLGRLHAQGYDVVTVSELLGTDMEAGCKYFSAP